jgi:hypothetical protein
MSEATSGETVPAYRFAHAGYGRNTNKNPGANAPGFFVRESAAPQVWT